VAVLLGGAVLFFAYPSKDLAPTLTARVVSPPAARVVSPPETAPALPLESAPAAASTTDRIASLGKASSGAGDTTKGRAQAPKPVAAAKPAARERREAKAAGDAKGSPAIKAQGMVRLAVSPWGEVDVDGRPAGSAPPLTELSLNEGKHQITIRNADFPPFSTTVTVTPGQAVSIKHKFGS
jgi:serine/threonine-protein kinase